MKTRIIITTIATMLLTNMIMAKPMNTVQNSLPAPLGGMETLKKQTTYPEWARLERMSGEVVLNFHVDATGHISDIQVVKSAGALFDNSAVSAVMNATWAPAQQNGHATAVRFELPFEFRYK